MGDAIYALASAQGKAGVAVVRLSGAGVFEIVEAISGTPVIERAMVLRVLRDGDGARLDQALVLTFVGPHSFTGEDVAELHLHGSMAVVAAVMRRLSQLGCRLAEPGEFSRRALENGKLDLTQIEGLADLIEAETEQQRRQAERVLSGAIGRAADGWRASLIRAASLIEVSIDFADEEVPVDVTPEVTEILAHCRSEIAAQLSGQSAAERVRAGFEVAIVGAPNVGKSTLLNRLAGREAAITSEVAGTTRDVIEVRMDLMGLPVTILDTAGLRETSDVVESLGIERARERAERADLRVFLTAGDETPSALWQPGDLVRRAKGDVTEGPQAPVSGKTGLGLERLINEIGSELAQRSAGAGFVVHERQRIALEQAIAAIDLACDNLAHGPERYDITAEELRTAVRALEILVGRVGVEDLLDEIFSRFCLGK